MVATPGGACEHARVLPVPPRHPFDALVRSGERIRTAEAALWFAVDAYPGLDVPEALAQLAQLAEEVRAEGAGAPGDRIAALRRVLVETHGYRGNTQEYYDPANSYLNEVLQRGVGLPITLSVLWLDVAESLGWDFFGIGLPGHFCIGTRVDGEVWLVDPFHDGQRLERDEAELLLLSAVGQATPVTDAMLEPVAPADILLRQLNNLRGAYQQRNDWRALSRVLQRMLALRPQAGELRSQFVRVQARLGSTN
jgi:regulator of sirC expression with transglutaminase-like and TPR domain